MYTSVQRKSAHYEEYLRSCCRIWIFSCLRSTDKGETGRKQMRLKTFRRQGAQVAVVKMTRKLAIVSFCSPVTTANTTPLYGHLQWDNVACHTAKTAQKHNKWTESNVTVFYSKTFKPRGRARGMDTGSKPPKRSQYDGNFERTNQIHLGSPINMEADQLPMSWFEMLHDISRGLTLFLQRQKAFLETYRILVRQSHCCG